MSWLVRIKLVTSLQFLAPHLLKISRAFDSFGSDESGFYLLMFGRTNEGGEKSIVFELVARDSDGLYIPCIPAILMAKKLIRGEITATGAMPCMGFIGLDEYLSALDEFNIQWRVREEPSNGAV